MKGSRASSEHREFACRTPEVLLVPTMVLEKALDTVFTVSCRSVKDVCRLLILYAPINKGISQRLKPCMKRSASRCGVLMHCGVDHRAGLVDRYSLLQTLFMDSY